MNLRPKKNWGKLRISNLKKKTWTAVCFHFPSRNSTLRISSYPPVTIPRLQTNHNYCADQVLSVSTSAYALIHRFCSWSAGRWIAVWQLGNFDKSLQDRNLYLRWRWGDCCFTSNPTEGPTSYTAVINREFCLRNFRLRYWWLHDVRSSIVVRLLIHFPVYVC